MNFSVSAACGEASEAPARPCAHHDECDDDYLCGPAGVCVAAEACDADSGCCPGAVCFNGWCRPTQACGVGALGACEGLGQVCEGGQCVAAPCAGPGECPSGWGCVAGRCVVGAPCGDRCGTGQVCEAGSGRCLPAAPGPSCGPGARAVVAGGLGADPWSCHAYAWPVECAALPEVEAGAPGVDGRAVATGSGPALVSYDPRYGDLVYTRFEGPGGGRRDFVLDGLPPGAFEAGIEGYRWGSPTPGPDRGWRPAVGRERTAEGPLEVLYGDTDTGGVRYGSFEPMAGAALGGGALPIAGRAGRWSCLSWRGVGQTVRLAGLVFIEADERGERSTLVRFEALVESPTAPEHWRVEPVFEVPLPPLDEEPCGGSCGLAAVCVRGLDGLDGCASTAAAGACAAPCGPREVCGRLGAGAATCLSRVYPRYEAERTPFGRGLFVDCARDADGELVAAWYDADARHLEAGRWPFAEGDRAVVDGGGGADRGRQVRIAVSLDGRIGLAYRDEGESALRYAEAASARGPWTVTTVHAPEGADADLGAWPDLRFDAAGAPVVAYGDAVAGGVWVARRDGSGCWARARAFAAGSYAWPGVLDLGDGALSVTARAHAFAPDLSALHAPVWARVPLPACGG